MFRTIFLMRCIRQSMRKMPLPNQMDGIFKNLMGPRNHLPRDQNRNDIEQLRNTEPPEARLSRGPFLLEQHFTGFGAWFHDNNLSATVHEVNQHLTPFALPPQVSGMMVLVSR